MRIKWYEKLKKNRTERGLSRADVSELTGLSIARISNAENGISLASDDVVSILQNYYLLGVKGRL